MANKRFLGLGFSFSAQDRGLEKKLLNIKAAIDGINESLTKVSSSSSKANSGIMNVSSASPKGDPMKNAARMLKVAKKAGLRPTRKKEEPESRTMTLSEGFSKLNAEAQSQVKDIFNEIAKSSKISGSVLYENTKEQLNDLKITVDKSGNLTKKSREDFFKTIKSYAEGTKQVQAQMNLMSRAFMGLGAILIGVKGYISDVGRSFETLLQTVGVNLRDLIPPQLSALLGVAKAVIAPLVNLPGKIGGFFKQKMTERAQKESLKLQKKFVDSQGFSGGSDTLKAALIDLKPEGKKGGGFFDKLKDVFGKLKGVLGGLAAGAAASLAPKAVYSVFEKIIGAIASAAASIWGFLKALPTNAKTWIGMTINTIKSFFTETIPGLFKSIGSGAKQALEYLRSIPKRIKSFFSGLGESSGALGLTKDSFSGFFSAGSKILKGIGKFFKVTLWGALVAFLTEGALGAIVGFVSGLKDGLSEWDGVLTSWKKALLSVGSFVMEVGGLIKDSFSFALNKVGNFFKDAWSSIVDGASGVAKWFEELRKNNVVIDLAATAVEKLFGAIKRLLEMIEEGWRNIGGWIVGGTGMLSKGAGNMVKEFFDDATGAVKKARQNIQEQSGEVVTQRMKDLSSVRVSPMNALAEQSQVRAEQQQVVALLQTQTDIQKAQLEQTQTLTQVTKDKEFKVDMSKLGIGSMSAAVNKRRSDVAEAMARGLMSQSPVTPGM